MPESEAKCMEYKNKEDMIPGSWTTQVLVRKNYGFEYFSLKRIIKIGDLGFSEEK